MRSYLCHLQMLHELHLASFLSPWSGLFSLNFSVRQQLCLSSLHGKCPQQIYYPNIISKTDKLNNSAQLAEQTHTFTHVNGINEQHFTVSVFKPTSSPVTRLRWLTANSTDTNPRHQQSGTRPAEVPPKTTGRRLKCERASGRPEQQHKPFQATKEEEASVSVKEAEEQIQAADQFTTESPAEKWLIWRGMTHFLACSPK